MNRRHFYLATIAVASLAYHATFFCAQTTRARQDSESAVTSLTNLSRLHRDSTPFGRIDSSADDTVDLTVSGELDQMNPEAANPNLRGSGSERAALQQGMRSSARFSQSRSSQNLTEFTTYAQPSSLRTRSTVPPSSFVPTRPYSALQVSDRQQAPTATMNQSMWGMQSENIGSDVISRKLQIIRDARDYEKVSRSKTFTSDPRATDVTGTVQQSPFERLIDPFFGPLKDSFEGFNKSLDMEKSCGDACSLRLTGRFDSFGSEKRGLDHPAERPYSHKTQVKPGAESRLYGSRELK